MLELARHWLRLPEGNPPLPAGDPRSVRVWNPGQGYLGYRRLGFAASALPALAGVIGMAGGGVALLSQTPRDMPPLLGLLLAGALLLGGLWTILGLGFGWFVIRLELDMLRYTLTDRAMRLRRGVVKLEEVTFSYANVQNVQLVQGPIQRWFGIGDLIVETAGGGGAQTPQQAAAQGHRGLIKGVSQPDALRDVIVERVRAYRGAGLGDRGDARARRPARARPASTLASPEACALLREIRDGLAALPQRPFSAQS